MIILFLHGWHSVPGGVKPTYLKEHGHSVINPKLPDDDFKEAHELQDRMARKHKELLDRLRPTRKPLMVAPFFNETVCTYQKPQEYAEMWGRILKAAPIDVIALQDGIGEHHCTAATINLGLEPLKTAIHKANPATQLWSDLETFELSKDGMRCPACFERVQKQLESEGKFVDRFTSFSFNHFNSPKQSFFAKYKRYVNGP